MKPMTKQEVFDKVATHLLTQNKRSLEDTSCVYRAKDGSMCAAGCLIPDEEYTPALEGWQITACYESFDENVYGFEKWNAALNLALVDYRGLVPPRPEFVKLFSGWERSVVNFLRELQEIHDDMPVADWCAHLRTAANRHELNTDVLRKMQ